jgi:myo-inositol-1(or 4)-monophosphatase
VLIVNGSPLHHEHERGVSGLSARDRQPFLESAVDAVHAAEAVLETALDGEIRVLSWLSHDLKLEVDRLCETAVVDSLRDQHPDDSILSEESGLLRGSSEGTWIVDPLDGTVNFAHGLPFYAISVAYSSCRPESLHALWQTHTEVAAISLPSQREMYLATRGGGATRNDVSLSLAPHAELERAMVCLGVSPKNGALPFSLRMVETLAGRAQKLRSLGAIAGELAFLAAGRFDALVQRGTNLWDFAAAALLVTEAGGRFEAEEFAPSRWQVVAANPGLFDGILSLVREG